MKHKSLIGAILGAIFTPFAISITLKSLGHGDYYWAGVFFPLITMIMLAGAKGLAVPFVFIQYPLFGWYTGRCISREHYIRLAVVWLVLQIIPMLVAMLN